MPVISLNKYNIFLIKINLSLLPIPDIQHLTPEVATSAPASMSAC